MLDDLQRPLVAGDQDVGNDLSPRSCTLKRGRSWLDQVGFEQQRLGLGRGRDDLYGGRCRDHPRDSGLMPGQLMHRTTNASAFLALPTQKHALRGVEHPIDAGRWCATHRVRDRGPADRAVLCQPPARLRRSPPAPPLHRRPRPQCCRRGRAPAAVRSREVVVAGVALAAAGAMQIRPLVMDF